MKPGPLPLSSDSQHREKYRNASVWRILNLKMTTSLYASSVLMKPKMVSWNQDDRLFKRQMVSHYFVAPGHSEPGRYILSLIWIYLKFPNFCQSTVEGVPDTTILGFVFTVRTPPHNPISTGSVAPLVLIPTQNPYICLPRVGIVLYRSFWHVSKVDMRYYYVMMWRD